MNLGGHARGEDGVRLPVSMSRQTRWSGLGSPKFDAPWAEHTMRAASRAWTTALPASIRIRVPSSGTASGVTSK